MSEEPMVEEFDTVASWTADAVEELGQDHALPAACRGSGSPAALRWLADRMGLAPGMRLLDSGAGLPGAARDVLDFAADPAVLDLEGVDGISASALFDLVSRDWFARFVNAAAHRPLLLALSAHGEHRWFPGDAEDAAVMGWFARDMRRDKGFGPAMGFAAPTVMAECLADAGYRVRLAASNWRLKRDQPAMLHAMIDTVAGTAAAQGDPERAAGWRRRRRQCAADGLLELIVEHRDILALSGGA